MTPPDPPAPAPGLALTDDEFNAIRRLVHSRFGIHLADQKRTLVVGRLQKALRERKCATFADYLAFVERDASGEALSDLINRISTNHTFFFREPEHFSFLTGTILPELIQRPDVQIGRDLRIWSAGCSSGEEPYSIAITLQEYLGADYPQWKAGVLATDISSDVLRLAARGIFPTERLAKMPDALRSRYFRRTDADHMEVVESIRKEITFRRLNFMSPAFPFRRPFHVIFCRNVMIYFDAPTRQELTQKFHRVLEPGGYLLIGHSESLGRDDTHFEYVKPAVYRRK